MKSNSLLLLAAACIASLPGAYAQDQASHQKNATLETRIEAKVSAERARKKLAVGLKGGANFSTGRYKDSSKMEIPGAGTFSPDVTGTQKAGMLLGLSLEVPLTHILFLQPELNYAQKGFVAESPSSLSGSSTSSRTLDFRYVELPLLFKIKGDFSRVKPYAALGGSVGYLLSQDYSAKSGNTETGGSFRRDDFQKFEATALGAIGCDVVINDRVSLVFEGRYSRGLTNVMAKGFGNDAQMQFHGIQALTGLQVSL